MLQNMCFGWEIFTWSHLYSCVIDFRKVESTLFDDSSTLIGAECIKTKMGLPEQLPDKTIAEEPVDMQQRRNTNLMLCANTPSKFEICM